MRSSGRIATVFACVALMQASRAFPRPRAGDACRNGAGLLGRRAARRSRSKPRARR